LDVLPIINTYHSGIGLTFEDKNGKIIRSLIFEIELGALSGTSSAINRYLCPTMCMHKIDGKSPLDFTAAEFITNLFIDTSSGFSSMNVNFLEAEDYETENLLNSMSCVGLNNLDSGAGMPFADLTREHYTVGDLYSAYERQQHNLHKYGGNADGRIFLLLGFGPSPLDQKGGTILNFASSYNNEIFEKLLDWTYATYAGCSQDFENNLQYYCMIGVDKVTPLEELSENQIHNELKKPNIIGTSNGFLREMRGKTTHCNVVCASYITLLEMMFSDDSSLGAMLTDFENQDLQSLYDFGINPTICNLPIAVFPKGWEYGISIKELIYNPNHKKDKEEYYKITFFIFNNFSNDQRNLIQSRLLCI